MFRNREDAGLQLAARLQRRLLRDPLVLAIPRGGVVTGAALATRLGAELDVILSRKLRAPEQPECAIGAVSEDGQIYLNREMVRMAGISKEYMRQERARQFAEIARRLRLIRQVRPRAKVAGRSVIVTNDGIATGSTMIAALAELRGRGAGELIVAVPVAPADRLHQIRRGCDDLICLLAPDDFLSVGHYYEDFEQVQDERMLELLREVAPVASGNEP